MTDIEITYEQNESDEVTNLHWEMWRRLWDTLLDDDADDRQKDELDFLLGRRFYRRNYLSFWEMIVEKCF